MLRSLISGVAGLRNHLVRLDVIGNNIANVNTTGFKSGRVTFKDTLSQLLQGSSRPVGDLGGINPIQLGSGMAIGSIDTLITQGGLESTGNITDLAIQGEGYFFVSDGNQEYFTRSGAFQFDGNAKLVSPTNGFAVQGRLANTAGVIGSGVAVSDIVLPFGQRSAAKATSSLSLMGNLNADSVKGSILDSSRVYGLELTGSDTDLNGLFAFGATDDIISGLVTNVSYVEVSVDGGTTTQKYYYNDDSSTLIPADSDGAFKSLDELVAFIDADFASLTVAITNGQIQFTSGAADQNLVLSSSHPSFNRALAQANDSDLDAAETSTSDVFMHKAISTDLLTDLRNSLGETLGLIATDTITINAKVGGSAVNESEQLIGVATTYDDFKDALNSAIGIVNPHGLVIDPNDGSLTINGDGGTANALTQLDVVAISATRASRSDFDQVFSLNSGDWTSTQTAVDATHQATITYYDSIGNDSTLTFTFSQDDSTSNRWFWEVSVDAPAVISSGATGVILFNEDGSLKEFAYDNSATSLQINPNNGADNPITVEIDSGTYSTLDGVTQGSSPSTLVATNQDGHPMGTLDNIAITKTGEISGMYTNGVSKVLAQLVIATFNNPSGLFKTGDNMYQQSDNSGLPIIGTAGVSVSSVVTPGALELSNVDLATEFTNMIVAQRGFQANARVITTGNEILTELVNLKR